MAIIELGLRTTTVDYGIGARGVEVVPVVSSSEGDCLGFRLYGDFYSSRHTVKVEIVPRHADPCRQNFALPRRADQLRLMTD